MAAGEIPLLPFDVDQIVQYEKSVWDYNDQLFVFETMDELKTKLRRYFDQFAA